MPSLPPSPPPKKKNNNNNNNINNNNKKLANPSNKLPKNRNFKLPAVRYSTWELQLVPNILSMTVGFYASSGQLDVKLLLDTLTRWKSIKNVICFYIYPFKDFDFQTLTLTSDWFILIIEKMKHTIIWFG